MLLFVLSLACLALTPPVRPGEIFTNSLAAEIAKYPRLLELKEDEAERFAPQHVFGRRRKGYHKAPGLQRVTVLKIFKTVRKRGELFVITEDKATGHIHNGIQIFGHGLFLHYLDECEPKPHVVCDKRGVVKSTDKFIWQLHKFVPMNTPRICINDPIGTSLYGRPYVCDPIGTSLYGRPYACVHIGTHAYGRPYRDTHTYVRPYARTRGSAWVKVKQFAPINTRPYVVSI